MLEKVGRMAEQVATNVSRRQFLGRFGSRAAALAAAVGGLLALPGFAQADRPVLSCGSESVPECQGRVTGDACYGAGTCRRIRGSTGCYCRIKGNR